MQITQPYREYTARTQFNPSSLRGLYLDLREKLYLGSVKGHRKYPDSLAPRYKAQLATIEARRFLFHLFVRAIYVLVALWFGFFIMSCSNSPTAPATKVCPAGMVMLPTLSRACVQDPAR